MMDTAEEARTESLVTFFCGPLHMDEPVLFELKELIYISSVRTQDVVWQTYWDRWMMGRERERVREIHAAITT